MILNGPVGGVAQLVTVISVALVTPDPVLRDYLLVKIQRYQRMQDREFRDEQHARLSDPHIAPITKLIDRLCAEPGRGWMPYVAPMYGGTAARVLSIFQDPGPKTRAEGGSGMLCCENEDDSAALHATLLSSAKIPPAELLPWNGYPWYRHETGKSKPPTAAQCDAGVEPLRQLIELAPGLRVVMLHGGTAQDVWARFERRHRSVSRRFHRVSTYHTGARVFMVAEPERTDRLRHLYESFSEVAGILRREDAA